MPVLRIAPLARFTKTEAGRQEIRARAHTSLSRSARNLLLILDGTRPGAKWLALVHGASPVDLHALLRAGLVAPCQAAAPGAGGHKGRAGRSTPDTKAHTLAEPARPSRGRDAHLVVGISRKCEAADV